MVEVVVVVSADVVETVVETGVEVGEDLVVCFVVTPLGRMTWMSGLSSVVVDATTGAVVSWRVIVVS